MLVGSRVVRGPDWKFEGEEEDEDGGEGFVGTITSIENFQDGSPLPKETVLVYWDTGYHGIYRAGQDGCYDLRILDSASAGIKFLSYSCDGCNQEGIAGMRWQCTVCPNYNLCTLCYMNDEHDKDHRFMRFDTSGSNDSANGIVVGQRSTCSKIQAKGIFPSATVKTGNDWTSEPLGNGIVLKLDSWEGIPRSAAMVDWDNFCELLLRVGHGGKVDVQLITFSFGPLYYKDHLPTVSLNDKDSLKKQEHVGSIIESNQKAGQQKEFQQELTQRLQKGQQSDSKTTSVKSPPPRPLPKPSPRLRNNNSNNSKVVEPSQARQGQTTTEPTNKVKDLVKRMSQADMGDSAGRPSVKPKAPAPPPPANRVDPSNSTIPKTSKKNRPAPPPPRPHSAIVGGFDNISPELKTKETKVAPSRTHVASLRASLGNLQLDPTRGSLMQTKKPPARELKCASCDENASKVFFEPCGHFVDVYCLGCARKLKRCLQCNEPINKKTTSDGSQLTGNDIEMDASSSEKVKELERQLAEAKREIECPICMDKRCNVLFGCGHRTCMDCSELIRQDKNICPYCKQFINERKRMF